MKILFPVILLIAMFLGYRYYQNSHGITRAEFNQVHKELRQEIDTIKFKLDSVNIKLKTLELNQDSLKAGQVIIYKQITSKSNTNFLDNLIDFMN